MAYTTIDKPSDYFNTKLYTGNGTAIGSGGLAVTGVGFQPDWVWLKNRTTADRSHQVYDVIRGVTKGLKTNSADAENTNSERLAAFGSDGFTVGNNGDVNTSGNAYVSWNWKAGTSFTNDASSTGIGTIDSNGSVSSDAGFGIVKWSGTGSAGTIAHGMGSTPSFLIIKRLSEANWLVQTTALGYGNYLALNTTDASASASTLVTGVSSTLVTLGNNGSVNGSGEDYIGYFFSEKKGYSKFGSYTGNGSTDGTFVYTGFKPAFTLIKAYSIVDKWSIFDGKRNPFNEVDLNIRANLSDAEVDQANKEVDYLSNGIKLRTASGEWNSTGTQYIFMSFAENPFTTSSGVPACAR